MIKFRGMPIKELANGGKWLYGNLHINYEDKLAYIDDIPVHFDSVGQYIGNCDMSEDELYDGDILEVINGSTDDYKRFIAQIHRHDSSFNLVHPIYVNSIIAEPVPYFIRNTGKKLGNIHEHNQLIAEWKERIEKENVNRI